MMTLREKVRIMRTNERERAARELALHPPKRRRKRGEVARERELHRAVVRQMEWDCKLIPTNSKASQRSI